MRKKISAIGVVVFTMSLFYQLYAAGVTGEVLSTQRWRDLYSRYSPTINPAFMAEENYLTLRGCAGLVLENAFQLTELGAVIPLDLYQTFGITYLGENSGSIEPKKFDENGNMVTDQLFDKSNFDMKSYFMLSYANNVIGNLSIGVNFTFLYQKNFDKTNLNSAADIGATYRLLLNPVVGEHLLGVTMQNVLAPFDFAKNSYSNNVKLSWLAYFWDRQIDAGVDFSSKNLYGAVFKQKNTNLIEPDLSVRLGAWILRVLNLYIQAGSGYYGFSGGVNVPHINNGRDFSLCYQFLNLTDADAASTHSIYMRVQIGSHREEKYAERMARSIDMAPGELYNKALKLYYADKYWDAFFIFSQILVQYPNFFKNDWIKYYKSSCLEKMDMRDAALDNYRQMVKDYPRSPVVPMALLGEMRINYREDMNTIVYNTFTELNNPEVSDSIKSHAYYLLGETYLKEGNYQQAAQVLEKIPETHPEYLFAQHSLAVVNILVLNMEDAINALGNCIEYKAESNAQKEIVNRSYVLLGYIFYEQMALSKAVTALRSVPKTSIYYEDAMLGLCWTALRARQWTDCISLADNLTKSSSQVALQCDAGLIVGYAYMMQKNYKAAFDVLQSASTKARELKIPQQDSLEIEKNKYQNVRREYTNLAQSIDKLSMEMQSSSVIEQLDTMQKKQIAQKKNIDDYYHYSDKFGRAKFFTRNIDVIKSDIEYALAISQKISQQTIKNEAQTQEQDKQKEIDSEIERLKKEMEKLNEGKK